MNCPLDDRSSIFLRNRFVKAKRLAVDVTAVREDALDGGGGRGHDGPGEDAGRAEQDRVDVRAVRESLAALD